MTLFKSLASGKCQVKHFRSSMRDEERQHLSCCLPGSWSPLRGQINSLSPDTGLPGKQLAQILQESPSPSSAIQAVAFLQGLPSTRDIFSALLGIHCGLTSTRGYRYLSFPTSFISGANTEAIFFFWFPILPDVGLPLFTVFKA